MSPALPKWQPRRTVIDLYNDRDQIRWYWRAAAVLSACLVMTGFLVFPSAFQSIAFDISTKTSTIIALILLIIGFILSLITALICRSWVFQLDILYYPCMTSCLLGLINIIYNFTLHESSSKWTNVSVAATVISIISTVTYAILALLTFRKISIVRTRDAMHRYHPNSSADKMMPETELQRQQLLGLLLQQEDAKNASPDNLRQTFKIEWPGNNETRRSTLSTLRNLPRAARAAYESRSSAYYMVQDSNTPPAARMDSVEEEATLESRLVPLPAVAYTPPTNYNDQLVPGIVNTRSSVTSQALHPISPQSPPQLQSNGYPVEKLETQYRNEPRSVERHQYRMVDPEEARRLQVQRARSTSRESRRMEIELAERGQSNNRAIKGGLEGVEVIGSIRRVETDGWRG